MNISKQAIEAGAEAEWNGQQYGPRWLHIPHEQQVVCRERFSAGLTAALEHIIPRECDDALYKIFWDAYNDAPMNILRPIKTTQDAHKAGFSAVLSHLRGEGKSDCNIQPKNVQSQPEIETQVEIDLDDVERVARAMYLASARLVSFGEQPKEAQDVYRREATAAIRAMKGQLWGVWYKTLGEFVTENGESDGKPLLFHSESVASSVIGLVDTVIRDDMEVRPYTAPREESAEEIASKCLAPVQFWSTKEQGQAVKDNIIKAIREAEKRGTAKCG